MLLLKRKVFRDDLWGLNLLAKQEIKYVFFTQINFFKIIEIQKKRLTRNLSKDFNWLT